MLRVAFDHTDACTPSVLNADIGGVGILIGLYLPALLVTCSLSLGRLTSSDTGTRELSGIVLMSRYADILHDID